MDTNGYWPWSDSAKLSEAGRKKKVVEQQVGEMKEKWARKQKSVDILERPVAERHDSKKHEDSADADDEHDDHDHRVAVALFYCSHRDRDKHAACKKFEKVQKRDNDKRRKSKCWERGREK